MKTGIRFSFAIILVLLVFASISPEPPKKQSIGELISETQAEMLVSLDKMDEVLKNKKPSSKKLLISLQTFRFHYKQIEFLVDYFDQGSAGLINPNPFQKVDISNPQYIVLEPQGMQILEELLAEEIPDWNQVRSKVFRLKKSTRELFQYSPIEKQLNQRSLYLAVRYGLIRTATLGITGFDAPANEKWLEETRIAIRAMRLVCENHLEEFSALPWENLIHSLDVDPDNFEAFEFYQKTWNPFFESYTETGNAQFKTSFTPLELRNLSVNPFATKLFSFDFLNADAFSQEADFAQLEEKLELGKMLFFDPVLSSNNKRACASCHNPFKAFSDGQIKSIAFDMKGTVNRNSPSLLNAGFQNAQFWDLREEFLENQMDHVLLSHQEFNTNYTELILKLQKSAEYDTLFSKAFPQFEKPVNYKALNIALATYVRSLVSGPSVFDKMINGEMEEKESIILGFNIFMNKAACGTCHFPPLFGGLLPPFYMDSESEVLGTTKTANLGDPELDADLGRFYIHQAAPFRNGFKTPSLRNISQTAPYMHNGAFPDLKSVLEFYNKGGGVGLGLDIPNQTLPPEPLDLSDDEMDALLAFLKSLDGDAVYTTPEKLPHFNDSLLNMRVIGGLY